MKKTLLVIFGLCFIAACGESSGFSGGNDKNNQDSEEYIPEVLLGKTVEEYERAQAAYNEDQAVEQNRAPSQPKEFSDKGFIEMSWDGLIAPGYDPETIMKKYEPLIDKIDHGSDDALVLYQKMEAEFSNAPANKALAGNNISIPGFIAPLEFVDGLITEFLLVPYFGACIHAPPPPSNQTLYVKVAKGSEIRNEDSYDPIWVSGQLAIESASTDLGSASYKISDAAVAEYIY